MDFTELATIIRFVRRRRQAVLAGLLVATAVGVVIFGSLPQLSLARENYQAWQETKTEYDQLVAKQQQLAALPQTALFQQQDLINRVLPSQKPVFQLVNSVLAVASDNQVRVIGYQLSPGEVSVDEEIATEDTLSKQPRREQVNRGATGVEEFKITVSIEGSQRNTNQFVDALNQTLPLISLTELEIDTLGDDDQNEVRTTALELSTFFFTGSVTSTLGQDLPRVPAEQLEVMTELSRFQVPAVVESDRIFGGGQEQLFGDIELQ